MYPYVVKVMYYIDGKETHENFLLYGNDIVDIASRVKDLCDPEDITIQVVGAAGEVFSVPNDIADYIILGNGDYDFGKRVSDK